MTKDILSNEYESLRQEAMDNRKIQVQIAFASPTFTGAIVGLLFSAKGSISETAFSSLLLIPVPLLVFNMLLILERAKSSVRIVAYLEKFLESKNPSPGWETRLEIWRARRIKKQKISQLPKGLLVGLVNFLLFQIPAIIKASRGGRFKAERYLDWNFYTITGAIHLFLCIVLLGSSIAFGYRVMLQNYFLLSTFALMLTFVLNMTVHVTWEIYTMLEYKQECREFWEVIRQEEIADG